MRLLAALVVLISVSQAGFAATIIVPDDYPAIQDAIDAAANGDTIVVRPGTYVENIDFLGKAIAVRSEKGPEVTIIDGGEPSDPLLACVVRFINYEGPDSIIDGFTLTNGRGVAPHDSAGGGGVHCFFSAPTIANNIITQNRVSDMYENGYGGGISVRSSYLGLIIVNNIIRDNFAGSEGGGIYLSDVLAGNIEGNLICDNHADDYGGGVYFNYSDIPLDNNVIVGNDSGNGGGVCGNYYSGVVVRNCTVLGNSGGGISTGFATGTIRNSILWGNTPFQLSQPNSDVTYSDIQGGYAGTGNIDAYPGFVDPVHDDFHLTWQSPCREAGNNADVISTLDREGDPRIAGELVDMGADEFYFHLYHVGDVVPGATVDIKIVGAPGMAPVRLGVGLGVLDPPRPTPYGDLYLGPPIVYMHNLGAVPANGVLVFPATIPSFWSPGDAKALQALVGAIGGIYPHLTNLEVLRVR